MNKFIETMKCGGGKFAVLLTVGAFAVSANAAYTEPRTNVVDGLRWRIKLDTSAKTCQLGYGADNTASTALIGSYQSSSVVVPSKIPSTFVEDGETYITRALANFAFSYSYGTTGSLVIPQEITSIGNYVFSWSYISQYCFKGPVSEPQGVTQTFQTITPGSDGNGAFYGNVKRNFLFVGPNVKIASGSSAKNLIRNGFTGGSGLWTSSLTVILPSRSDNTSWASLTASDIHPRDASKAKLFFYGPAEEFDILMHETSVTMIPTTANALTNVLNWASTFKTKFGLDTKISVTNAIEVGEGLITASKMQYATFNSLMFKAKTQSQLDSICSVVPASVPISIDPQDARETLTIPQGREVYVRLSGEGRNGQYTPKINGFTIIVQ